MAWFKQLFGLIFDQPDDTKPDSKKRTDLKAAKEVKVVRVNQLKRRFKELLYTRL
jgi:hypothetical protein